MYKYHAVNTGDRAGRNNYGKLQWCHEGGKQALNSLGYREYNRPKHWNVRNENKTHCTLDHQTQSNS